jgi:NADH dehydrogenase FAD-containing subunit
LEQNGCLTPQDVDAPFLSEQRSMGYAYRINIIKGRLTDIDRENKAVVVSDELVIEYDYLLISSWTQGM